MKHPILLFLTGLALFLTPTTVYGLSDFETLRMWAPACEGFPSKQNCDDGDATLFNGLLCSVGESLGCKAVAAAQDSTGRIWRSPRRVGSDSSNSFSRDMGLGVLLYLVKTRDVSLVEKWRDSIVAIGGLCDDATDGRCQVTPLFYDSFNLVAESLGARKLPAGILVEQVQEGFSADLTLLTESKFTPTGYALHLVSVQIYIRKILGRQGFQLRQAAKNLSSRQPTNLFFAALNSEANESLKQRLLQRLPREKPSVQTQWHLERDEKEEAWRLSMIWDYIFLYQLIFNDT